MLRRLTADESYDFGSWAETSPAGRGPRRLAEPLARTFEEAGEIAVSGFEMLLHQAAGQAHLMTGLLAPVEQMRAAGPAAMKAR